MEELHNHTENAEKFKGALDADALIYQHREEKSGKEQMKSLHGKNRREFFKQYYLKRILIIAAVLLFGVILLYNIVTTKNYALSILVVNASGDVNEEEDQEYFGKFLELNDMNTSKNEVYLNRSLNVDINSEDSVNTSNVQTIVNMFTRQGVDLFLSDSDFYLLMAERSYFKNLEDYLTEEEVASIDEENLVYVTLLETEKENGEDGTDDSETNAGETILAGIRLSPEEGWLADRGWYEDGMDIIVGLPVSVTNKELAVGLLKEILDIH
ncbi:MAG: hypothetical protein LIP12_15610 [Clostridiales bacterium]|nr:hypothetical protein [Clostridiales bacterium]